MSATLRSLIQKKRFTKSEKELAVLIGLVEQYIKTGVPVGSNFLKENGFNHLSSATIRNYFAKLEKRGFLKQQHISGGRIPTYAAYKEYAKHFLYKGSVSDKEAKHLNSLLKTETKKINNYLHQAAEYLGEMTSCAVFLSSPKFDQDFVRKIKLIELDKEQLVAVLITDFGVIHTESVFVNRPLTEKNLNEIEEFFLWRINNNNKPNIEDPAIIKIAQRIYNEVMVRHVVNYSNLFSEIYKTGLSKLLNFAEFKNPAILSHSLSLLETPNQMQKLLDEAVKKNDLVFWVGEDLNAYSSCSQNCTIIAVPYHINSIPVGAFAILGPLRMPYKKNFALLRLFSEILSESITSSIYKYKISFRKKCSQDSILLSKNSILLEDKSKF